jgi:hypothetical protein
MRTKRESGGLATLTHSSKDTAEVKSGLEQLRLARRNRIHEIRDYVRRAQQFRRETGCVTQVCVDKRVG